MIENIKIRKFAFRALFFGIGLCIFILILSLMSDDSLAETTVSVTDVEPAFINENSVKTGIFELTIHNNGAGSGSTFNWINITLVNNTGLFNLTKDLRSIDNTVNSGVLIYNESGSIAGYDPSDNLATGSTYTFGKNGNNWWVNLSISGTYDDIPDNDPGSPNWYVVIQTASTIEHDDRFRVRLPANGINGTWGNTPGANEVTGNIDVDTNDPTTSGAADTESPFIYYRSGTTTLYFGNDMSIAHSFNVSGSANDSGAGESGIDVVTFESTNLGAPVNDSSTSWSGTYDSVTSSSTSPGTITVTVYDNAGNTVTWDLTVVRDTTNPSITSPSVSESSSYIHVSGTTIYYGDDMGGDQPFTVDGASSDGGVGLHRATFSSNSLGSPSNDDSPVVWVGLYNVSSSDTWEGTITVTIYDLVNNSNTQTFTVIRDISDPTITSPEVTESSIYIYVNGAVIYYGDDMTGTESFTLQGTSSDIGSGLNIASFTDLTSSLGAPSNDDSPAAWAGTYNNVDSGDSWSGTITVTITDNVTNTNTTTFTVYRDTTNPGIVYVYPTVGGSTSWYDADPGAVIDINFTWEGGNNASMHNASYRIGSQAWKTIFSSDMSADYTTDWNLTWSDLTEGSNLISIRVYDAVGNAEVHTYIASTSGFEFLKDTSIPTITYNYPTRGNSTSWYSSDPGNVIDIDFGTLGTSPLVNATYRIGNGPWVFIFNSDKSSHTSNWGVPWADLAEGNNQISIRVYNKADKFISHTFTSQLAGFRIRKDTTAPGINYNSLTAGNITSWYTSDPGDVFDIDFLWIANSPLVNASYRIGSGSWIDIFDTDRSSNYATDWAINWSALAEGENQIHIRVCDKAGNILLETYVADTSGFLLKKDSIAPSLNSFTINSDAIYTNSTSVTLTLSASDATSGIYQMRISNDGTFDTEQWEVFTTTKAWILSTGDGTKSVYIQLRDYALITTTIKVGDTIILDTTPPSVSIPTLTPINTTEDTTAILNITVIINDGLGSGVFEVWINYTVGGSGNSGYEEMENFQGDLWRIFIDPADFSYTWDALQGYDIEYRIFVEDIAGNSLAGTLRKEYIDPVNDPPVISGAPTELEVTATFDKELDFTSYLSDVDNLLSELILQTDSNYATVSGFNITFNYPFSVTSEEVTITVSDGINTTEWKLKVNVNIAKVIKEVTKDEASIRILILMNADTTITTNVQPPGAPVKDMDNITVFKITATTTDWDWLYISVDYTGLDLSSIEPSTLELYYWDASTSSWVLCDNNGIDTTNKLVYANMTRLGTFAVFGDKIVEDTDKDNDNMPDAWETDHGLDDTVNDAAGDKDGDNLDNLQEFIHQTDPEDEDSDDDQLPDGWEVKYKLDPMDATGDNGAKGDPDNDKYSNLDEYKGGSKPDDDKSVPKKDDGSSDMSGVLIIIVVVIIFILLVLFIMYRRRGAGGEEYELGDEDEHKPKIVDGTEEYAGEGEEYVGSDLAEDYEPEGMEEDVFDEDEYEFEPDEDIGIETELEPGAVGVLRPEVTSIEREDRMEVMELGVVHPCGVCQAVMPVGEKVFQCTCGLITHQNCMGDLRTCPQCGKEIDTQQLGLKPTEKKKKPMIRAETKREIEERTPPKNAYFTFVPGKTAEKDLKTYIEGSMKDKMTGDSIAEDNLKFARLFISKESARIMLDHCYEKGRVKEVMGLMIGQTFKYNEEIFSLVKDIVTSDLDATEVNVKFDSFDKLFDQLDQIDYDYQIIGWYHSHPDYSSFMSPTDADTQARMFKHAYQYAVVIDPIRFDMNAFISDLSRKSKVREKPFAIINSEEVDDQG